jgi:hypothetical protein
MSVGYTQVNPSVYGQRQRDNAYTIDGMMNVENVYSGIPINPPPEAIAEMKVQSGMDSGAYGWASGANINLVTKSGTKDLHGDAWEFVRNNDLNARSYFLPSVGAYKWNQFGGTIGGPLVIPHLLSKERGWYVFGDYEGIRIDSASNYLALVPTAAQLGGDFSSDSFPIYNPYTSVVDANGNLVSRQAFSNNQIPSNLIDQNALTLAKELFPTPNLAPGVIPGVNYINVAPNINVGDQWSARVDHQFGQKDSFYGRFTDARNPNTSVSLPSLPFLETNHFTNAVASDTHTFSPTFLLTARFGVERTNLEWFGGGPDMVKDAGMLGAFPPFEGKFDMLPYLTIPGYPFINQGRFINGPEFLWDGTGDAQAIKGQHTISFGGGFMRNTFFTDCQASTFETFSSDQTALVSQGGDPLASYLLGLPESVGRDRGKTQGDMFANAYSLYVQDTFRVTPKLTTNLGLRWDYAAPMKNVVGTGTFEWETGQYYWDLPNPITGAPANIRRGIIAPDYRGFQPRVGIAYQVNAKTAVRTAYGIFFDTFGVNYGESEQGTHGNWPYGLVQTLGGLNLTLPTAFMQNPFPGPLVGTPTPLGCSCLNPYPATSRTPYVEEWNFSLQRQLTPSLLFEVGYFASHGVKISGWLVDNTAVVPGTNPYQDRQRWPNFPSYPENGYNGYGSWYDGLSVKLEKRYSRNLSFLASYTWSKTIDDVDSLLSTSDETGIPDTVVPTRFNINAFRGPAGFDIRHLFSGSYIYQIPGETRNKLADAVLAHWSLSGIVSADSGTAYFVVLSTDNENIGETSGILSEFPNLVSNPNAISNRSANEWFNTAAYTLPPFGTRGDAGKHVLTSDPMVNWNFALYKQWPFKESRNVELRGEFFDLLNASTFAPPGELLGTPQFGTIYGTRQGGRQIQLALKLHF